MARERLDRSLKRLSTGSEGPLRAAPLGLLSALAPEGQPLPTFATLDGAPVAVLALDDYRRLIAAAFAGSRPTPAAPQASTHQVPRTVSTIERDPEVADFLRGLFPRHPTIGQLRDACRERFGEARTPSATRITIFRQRAR